MKYLLTALLLSLSIPVFSNPPCDYARFVNPFIGVENGGNVFPGVSLPNALVKLGPDCGERVWNAGWDPAGDVLGFSHVHVSGTGGGCKYGNVLVVPQVGELNVSEYGSRRFNEQSEVGLYSVDLGEQHDISVRLSSTEHAGLHEYTFNHHNRGHILFDLGSFLQFKMYRPESQVFVGSEVSITSPTSVEGYTRIRGGWNMGEVYTVYFSAQFDRKPCSYGTWKNHDVHSGHHSEYDSGDQVGAYFTFDTRRNDTVKLKVGISFVSVGKARSNLIELENFSIDECRAHARQKWNRLFNKIKVQSEVEEDLVKFYSSLYRAYLQPTDKSGENCKWNSGKPYFDDFYAIWDTFRATNPLYSLITPELETSIVNSLLDIYSHEGYMPDARSGDCNGRVQGGSDADILIADALLKGLKGIDYEQALEAMLKNAEVPPGGDERKEGRGGLLDYNVKGYISTDYERAGSRTLEYSLNDYCIAVVAKYLGKEELYEKYLARSENWKNLWNPHWKENGFVGFIAPRNPDGSWSNQFSPYSTGGWTDFFYESHSWEMSMFVPHDMAALIEHCGGEKTFESRLDYIFDKGLWNVSNEPGFMLPHLYHFIGKPWKACNIIRQTLDNRYGCGKDGLPGNDDSGSMAAWYLFNSIGLFPNAGQDYYLITSPIFSHVSINLSNGRFFNIEVRNGEAGNQYIQSVALNGQPIENTFLSHHEIMEGGTLEITMGNSISEWGTNGEFPQSRIQK